MNDDEESWSNGKILSDLKLQPGAIVFEDDFTADMSILKEMENFFGKDSPRK